MYASQWSDVGNGVEEEEVGGGGWGVSNPLLNCVASDIVPFEVFKLQILHGTLW